MKKKILCLIDTLGPGGAERQMVGLASMLKEDDYEVEVWYHEPQHFFVDDLKHQNINCRYFRGNKISKLLSIRKAIQEYHPDTVIAYLQSSSILVSAIRLSGIKFKLIVSERNTNRTTSFRDVVRFNIFRVADYIVPNSYSQAKYIIENFPFLSPKVKTIINFVDTDHFFPGIAERRNTIIVVATIRQSKNVLGFIRAMKILKDKGILFHVKWFGKVKDQSNYILECENLITQLGLDNEFELLNKTHSIAEEYQRADYFCLPSFYEGTPNVICEAMASGLPIICSNVCDNGRYVEDGVNGYLFNPKSIEDIANTVQRMLSISDGEYKDFCKESRRKAVEMFSKKNFINNYIQLL